MIHRSTGQFVIPVLALVVTAFLNACAGAGDARATSDTAAEFDRITADMRAATNYHDPRAYHVFHAQLVELIRATTTADGERGTRR